MHLVCKVFYVSNQIVVCPYLMENNNLDPWVEFFKTILDMPTPEDMKELTNNTKEINRRDKSIFWKIKGIASKLTYRITIKYGDPSIVEDKALVKSFSNNFSIKYVMPLLESHLQIVLTRKNTF